MIRRILLSLIATSALSATSAGFAPAPVFREPPRSKVPDLLSAMQGTWDYDPNAGLVARGGLKRTIRVRIQGKSWTYLYIRNGVESEGATFEIVLDAKQNPPALDLRNGAAANRPALAGGRVGQVALKGIVKVEGDTLTYCYVSGYNQNATRPRQFDTNQVVMPNGGHPMIMTLRRVK